MSNRIAPVAWSLPLLSLLAFTAAAVERVNESARELPVAAEVDVVVVGGGTGAVSAAVAAAEDGAKVFLAAPHPYLGDDMTATLRLWLEPGEVPSTPLAQRIFADQERAGSRPEPARVHVHGRCPQRRRAPRHDAAQQADRWPMGGRLQPERPIQRRRDASPPIWASRSRSARCG